MAKRVTISVSDELHEKMKEWKSALNFSKVFQNAVSSMIRKKEALKHRLLDEVDLSSVVDRLKKEKLEIETDIKEKGKRDGFEWSITAHYKELQYVLAWKPHVNPFNDEALGAYFNDKLEMYRKKMKLTEKIAQEYLAVFSEKYLKGWKEGVEVFWSEVKDRI